jgi:glycosyltransferase involved in cell wall biosynthesis
MEGMVSICIATCNRAAMLREAIESCLNQTYADIEIVVSDDSRDDAAEQLVTSLSGSGRVRYSRNRPPRGQAGNVNRLFDLAKGRYLMLLHDDDRLLPDAVSRLMSCWGSDPTLAGAFGKQRVVDRRGRVLERASERLNRTYYRTDQYAGRQASALWSAMVGQFPNDGWIVLADAARAVGYRDCANVGDACDLDFSLRLAAETPGFCFLNEYTADYRLHPRSVSGGSGCDMAVRAYYLIEGLDLPGELELARRERLRQLAPRAVSHLLASGERRAAAKIYMSEHYMLRKRISVHGAAHAVLVACPPSVSVAAVSLLRGWRALCSILRSVTTLL